MATATTNPTVTTTWTKVATNPTALTIKCNTGGPWFLAVTSADSAPVVRGEFYDGPISWLAGAITGYVWLKTGQSDITYNFAVTTTT